MARTLIRALFRFANGQPAAGLTVKVVQGAHILATGQTSATGLFVAEIRDPPDVPPNVVRRPVPLAGPLRLLVQDALPNYFETALRVSPIAVQYVLPPSFDPVPAQSPADPHPAAGTAANTVDVAVQKPQSPPGVPGMPPPPPRTVNDAAPGHVLCIRKNGNPWVSVTRGLSRLARSGINPRAMTDDTIISIASMSKPVTATAVVAMIDDWAAIRSAFLASLDAGAPMTTLRVFSAGHTKPLHVPTILAPLFSNVDRAREFIAYVPPGTVADDVKKALGSFAHATLTVTSPLPATPAGYFGLLKRGIHAAAPSFSDPVWPLIKHRLGAGFSPTPQAAAVTIEQFLVHLSGYREPNDTSPFDGTVTAPVQVKTEPPGRRATFDLWGFIAGLMTRTPLPAPPFKYANTNFIALTALVEACTETSFDDYLTNRLFFDPRFDNLRRHVVDTRRCALYYAGIQPGFSGGTLFSDYTDFPGQGGLYVTANQFTDWLYALYARQPVARRGSAVPQPMIVSDANFKRLFSEKVPGLTPITTDSPFFGVGLRQAGLSNKRFQENGGAGSALGSVNGNMAIIVAPAGSVYTALFVANGDLGPVGGADPPWEAVVAAMLWGD